MTRLSTQGISLLDDITHVKQTKALGRGNNLPKASDETKIEMATPKSRCSTAISWRLRISGLNVLRIIRTLRRLFKINEYVKKEPRQDLSISWRILSDEEEALTPRLLSEAVTSATYLTYPVLLAQMTQFGENIYSQRSLSRDVDLKSKDNFGIAQDG